MKTIAKNDKYIRKLLNDVNYIVQSDGSIYTIITKTGKVSVNGTVRPCKTIRKGYRIVKYYGRELRVSRIVYMKFGSRPLLSNVMVGHLNGNTTNDNINNLFATSQSTINIGRFKRHPPVMGNTRLTWKDVEEIRVAHRFGDLTYSQISKIYKISKGHISEIINGKIWIKGKHYAFSKNVKPYVTGELNIQTIPKDQRKNFVPGDTCLVEADHYGGVTTIHKYEKVIKD